MKLSSVAVAMLLALAVVPIESLPTIQGPTSERPYQLLAATCFKTGEQTSGMNKICYYNCVGSAAAITIGAVQLCPLTIEH